MSSLMSLIGFFFQNGAQQIEVIGCCFLQIDQPTNQPIEPAPPPKKNKSNQNKEETVLCSERTAAQNVPVKQKPNQIKTTRGAVPNRCLKSMTQKNGPVIPWWNGIELEKLSTDQVLIISVHCFNSLRSKEQRDRT